MNRFKYRSDIILLAIVLIFNIHNIYCQPLKCSLHQTCLNQILVSSNISLTSNSLSSEAYPSLSHPLSSLYQCSCDSISCHIYGDCCLDIELNKTSLSIINYSCIHIFQISGKFLKLLTFQAISKCSKSWSVGFDMKYNGFDFHQIKSGCENSNGRDLMLTIPVTSNSTNITYKNFYCAICNFDIENAEAWKAETFCRNSSPNSCLLTFDEPTGRPLRNCYSPNLIDSCEHESTFYEIQLKCSLYLAPIKGIKGYEPVLFKNHYCAQCNNNTANKFYCPDQRKSSSPTQFENFSFSFSIILDISFKGKVGAQEECDENHIYDPWKKTCRRVYCRENSVFIDGKCIGTNDKINYTKLFDICPKILIDPQEFKQLSNGTVLIMASNNIYNKSQYVIDSSTSVLEICVNWQKNNLMKNKFDESHSYLTICCLTISIISLAIKISYFFLRPEPRRISSILVLFLSISLILAQLLFLFGINRTEIPVICQLIAIIMHYCFLASFFWMNVLSYDIYRTFASMLMPQSSNLFSRQLLIYTIYGWTLPLIITTAAVVVDQVIIADNDKFGISPGYGTTHCWIANRLALTVFLAAPLAILLIINSVLLLLTAMKIANASEATRFARENINQRKERFRFMLYIKLAVIMGSTWITGFVAAYAQNTIMHVLFIVLNSLQGLYVLLAFTHCRNSDLLHCYRIGTDRRTSNKSLSTSLASNTCTKL